MTINSRIKIIREQFCNDSNIELARILDVSRQYANNLVSEGKSVGDKVIDNILSKFSSINPIWLKLGEGEMLKDSQPAKPEEGEPSNYNILVQHLLSQLEKLEQANKELSETNKNLIEENKKLIADNGYYKGLLEQNGIKQTGTDN